MRRTFPLFAAFLLALTLVLVLTFMVSAAGWSDPFAVAGPGTRPDIALDANGEMYFVWTNPKTDVIQYRHCTSTASCDATETLPNLAGTARAPAIALDSNKRAVVVWEQIKSNHHTIYLSQRTGTWSQPTALSTQHDSEFPDIAIGDNDVSHVVYQSVQDNGDALYYVESVGGHAVNSQLLDLDDTANVQKIAQGRRVHVAVDTNNHAHVVWDRGHAPFKVYYTFQQNGGTFHSKFTIGKDLADQSAELAVDPTTNHVGIVWETRHGNHAAFVLLVNGGQLFRQFGVEGGMTIIRSPHIAADCSGKFHIAFQRARNDLSDWNIYYRSFNPTDDTFTGVVRVTTSQKDDAMPSIAATNSTAIAFVHGGGNVQGTTQALAISCPNGGPTPTPTLSPTPPTTGTEHVANDDARIQYVKAWKTLANSKASDGNFARCDTRQKCSETASAELDFSGGMRVEWETAYANTLGDALVYLDGKPFERVDLCELNKHSDKLKFAKRTYILSGNAGTSHSIKIVAMGSHSKCTQNDANFVVIDGFNILR